MHFYNFNLNPIGFVKLIRFKIQVANVDMIDNKSSCISYKCTKFIHLSNRFVPNSKNCLSNSLKNYTLLRLLWISSFSIICFPGDPFKYTRKHITWNMFYRHTIVNQFMIMLMTSIIIISTQSSFSFSTSPSVHPAAADECQINRIGCVPCYYIELIRFSKPMPPPIGFFVL